MNTFEQLFLVLLAWMLGTLTPVIAEAIRKDYRKPELRRAIVSGLSDLRLQMAWIAHQARINSESVTVEWLSRFAEILRSHTGPESSDTFQNVDKSIGVVEHLLKMTDEERRQSLANSKQRDGRMSLVELEIPLTENLLADLSLVSNHFRIAVLRIKHQLHIFNQHVRLMDKLTDRTFGPLSGQDRDNVDAVYRKVQANQGERAAQITEMIDSLRETA